MVLLIATMVIYYSLMYWAIKEGDINRCLNKLTKKEIILNLIMIFGAILVAYSLNIREKYIYYWDHSTYWIKSLEAFEICNESLFSAIKRIFSSIYYDDYNLLQGMLMALPLKILGDQYLSYILVIYIQFLIPTSFVGMIIIMNLLKKYSNINIKSYYIFGCNLFFVWFWQPTLNGYADMAAVLLVALCILITFSMDFCFFNPTKSILISVMLFGSVLLRRYFAYWVVGYSCSISIIALIQMKRFGWSKIKSSIINVTKNFIIIYGFMIVILIIFFKPFLMRSLFNNYAIAYQAYNTSDVYSKILELVKYLGIIYAIAAFCMVCYSVKKKKYLDEVIFLLISTSISVFTFYRTQNMGIQHYYIISVQMLILIVLGICILADNAGRFSKIVLLASVTMYMLNFVHGISLLPGVLQSKIIWSNNTYKPKQREDMEEILLLKKYIQEATPEREGVYVIGSSVIMTSDILSCSYLPNLTPDINILSASQVDLRDGFNTSFFDAKVIVCATPAQYHLSPETQRVTGILTDEFENENSPIRKNFIRGNSFVIENGVTVNVFIKAKNFTKAEVEYLANKFDKYYLDYPELFSVRFNDYANSLEK